MALTSSIRAHDEEGAIKHVFDVHIFGKTILTTVTSHPDAAKEWVKLVDGNTNVLRHIGFEIEFDNKTTIGTVQLCEGNRCLVIRLLKKSRFPLSLIDEFFSDRNNAFVGVNIISKMKRLRKQFPFTEQVQCIDLCDLASFMGGAKHRLFASIALGDREPTELGDPNLKLSDKQVQYACIDAFLNLQIVRWLWNI